MEYIGTLGVLMLAYDKKFMMVREAEQCLDIFLDNEKRLSLNLCNRVLRYVGLKDKFQEGIRSGKTRYAYKSKLRENK